MNIELASRLVSLRKTRGYSQESLASALNISRQAISKWERGETSPDTDNLIALALLYGISLDELVGFSLPQSEENEVYEECVVDEIKEAEEHVVEPEMPKQVEIPEEPPAEQGFYIEDDEHIVHICNGILTVTHKPKKKKNLFSKLFGIFTKLGK